MCVQIAVSRLFSEHTAYYAAFGEHAAAAQPDVFALLKVEPLVVLSRLRNTNHFVTSSWWPRARWDGFIMDA